MEQRQESWVISVSRAYEVPMLWLEEIAFVHAPPNGQLPLGVSPVTFTLKCISQILHKNQDKFNVNNLLKKS